MITLPLPPKMIKKEKNRAVFQIEGLCPGYGATIGNALRRVSLSSISGAAVTQVKIKGTQHEFSTIPGVLEDVIIILLNLKNLRFKIFEGETQKVKLKVKGEKEVKGSDFKLPTQVKLANPNCHIATITNKTAEFEIEVQVEKGVGYEPLEQRKKKKLEIGTIALDAIFTPVKKVNFQVENMRVGERTDFDRLNFEIETDGTTTPEEVFNESCQILIKHFSLFTDISKPPKKGEKTSETKEKKEDDLSKIMVEDIKLSGRTLNGLLKNNIKTVGGVLRKSEESLLELEGMGEKGMKELKRALKKLGLELKS